MTYGQSTVTASPSTPTRSHAIPEPIVRAVASDHSLSYATLTASLNTLQGVLVASKNTATTLEKLDRPNQIDVYTEETVRALVTPIVWWELTRNVPRDNTKDAAVIDAHRRAFKQARSGTAQYTEHQLDTMHGLVLSL